MKIELIDHVAKKQTLWGEVEVKFDQQIVMVDGREAGYVGTHEGAMFLPLAGFPHALQKKVDAYIAEVRKTAVVESNPAPPVVDPNTGEVVE